MKIADAMIETANHPAKQLLADHDPDGRSAPLFGWPTLELAGLLRSPVAGMTRFAPPQIGI